MADQDERAEGDSPLPEGDSKETRPVVDPDVPAGDETEPDDPAARLQEIERELHDLKEKSKSEKGNYEAEIQRLRQEGEQIRREDSASTTDPLDARLQQVGQIMARKIARLQQAAASGDEDAEEQLAELEYRAIQERKAWTEARYARLDASDREEVQKLAQKYGGNIDAAEELFRERKARLAVERERDELKNGTKRADREAEAEALKKEPASSVPGSSATVASQRRMSLEEYTGKLNDPTTPQSEKTDLFRRHRDGKLILTGG